MTDVAQAELEVPAGRAKKRRLRSYPAYRESGVDWIVRVPKHWDVAPVYARYDVALGKMLDEKRISGEELAPYLRNIDVQWDRVNVENLPQMDFAVGEFERYSLKNGDLLVCEGGEIGRAAIWRSELPVCYYQKAIHRLRPFREGESVRFLFYVLRWAAGAGVFVASANPNTINHLTAVQLRHHRFPFPPAAEQRGIASYLDRETARIDALVAKKQQLIGLLREKRAAMTQHVVMRGLHPSIALRDSQVDWLGQVPSHWDVTRAKAVFFEVNERSATGDDELLTVSHITGVTPRSEKNVYMFEAESTEGYKLCRPGDLAINTMWAWMGALGITRQAGIVSPSYNVYRLRDPRGAWYFDYLFRTPAFVAEINRWSQGVWKSRLRLYPAAFLEIRLPVPPPDERIAIAEHLRATHAPDELLGSRVERSIEVLQEQRDALIAAAVTGQIDVREEVPR